MTALRIRVRWIRIILWIWIQIRGDPGFRNKKIYSHAVRDPTEKKVGPKKSQLFQLSKNVCENQRL